MVFFLPSRATIRSINIWDSTGCKSQVRLTPYLAKGENNVAVILCPGGSYFWLARKTEGENVAKWLQANGISAFVLEYRVAGVAAFVTGYRLLGRGNRYPDMLQDVQRSIQLLREHAAYYGIDGDKLGVMGFSAGGHLAAMSGLFFDKDFLSPMGIKPEVSLKPDFIASIYPVVSFVDKSAHKRSIRGILGDDLVKNQKLKDSLSIENRVRPDMPPTYLMNCKDDPTVDYYNSELFDSAMTAVNVPHKYVRYETGGHGFGVSPEKTSKEAIGWKDDFINWLGELFREKTGAENPMAVTEAKARDW